MTLVSVVIIVCYNISTVLISIYSLFLTKDGEVYSCGLGADGQTGLGHYRTEWKPTKVEGAIKGEVIVKVVSTCDSVLAINGKLQI